MQTLSAHGPALLEAIVDPFEPLMPGQIKPEQAEHYAEALQKGQPNAQRIALTLFRDAEAEFSDNRDALEQAFNEKAPNLAHQPEPKEKHQDQKPNPGDEPH
jgi:hypothetical protein